MSVKLLLMGMSREPGVGISKAAPDCAQTLCVANTFIPLFWLLPFRRVDIHRQPLTDRVGDYPVLFARRELMLERLDRSLQPVCELLGPGVAPLLQHWMSYLSERACEVVLLETWDLWRAFADPQGLLLQVEDQFEALERLVETRHLSDEMRAALLEPANLLLPGCDSVCLDDISLTGYGWRAH